MFWIAFLVFGSAMVLFQLGALNVWVVVFQIAFGIVSVIAALLGITLVWKWISSKRGT